MRTTIAFLSMLLLAACSDSPAPTSTLLDRSEYIGNTAPTLPKIPVYKQDYRWDLASQYLPKEDAQICGLMMDMWDANGRSAPEMRPMTDWTIGGGTGWENACDDMGINAAAGCHELYNMMGMSSFYATRYLSSSCGDKNSQYNGVFTPDFVQDHRSALDPLWRLDYRGAITLEVIFQMASTLDQYPTFRGRYQKGMWAAIAVMQFDRGGFDAHDNGGGCEDGECNGMTTREMMGHLGASLGTSAFGGIMATSFSATGPPGWIVGITTFGAYWVGVATYEIGTRAYDGHCEGCLPADTPEEFQQDNGVPDGLYNPEWYDPGYEFYTDESWRLP